VFDHGAQYFKTPTPALHQLVTQELPATELFDITQPVWIFDAAGTIAEGDPVQNADPKWSYRSGLSMLAKLLGAGLDVRREVRISGLRTGDGGTPRWHLIDDTGATVGMADAVVFTPPTPQIAEILQASDISNERQALFQAALRQVSYRRCLSLAFGYARILHRPFYALVNTDRGHAISWVALEHYKGLQRCPSEHSLLIAQMAPQFSQDNWDLPLEQLTPLVTAQLGNLLAEDLDDPIWADRQAWRYALPDGRADQIQLDAPDIGLFFAGDYTAGQGRVHLAIEQGWRVAEVISAWRG
jgi:predicted NAD/FAD-dependent oxidoreductase